MNEAAQRIAIAEACGWSRRFASYPNNVHCWNRPGADGPEFAKASEMPDYLNDLNAMRRAELTLGYSTGAIGRYHLNLVRVSCIGESDADKLCHANAGERAEAFLKTIGKWKKSK